MRPKHGFVCADSKKTGSRGHGIVVWRCLFRDWLVVSKRLDHRSSKLARDDTVYSLVDLFWGSFPPFHLSTFPPSKILQILSILLSAFYQHVTTTPRHHVSTTPPHHESLLSTFPRPDHSTYIYGGMVLICITLPGLSLPWVNLIIYKDDLRMMASVQVVAKEGGMQEFEKYTRQNERLEYLVSADDGEFAARDVSIHFD